jgi:hypothetical protein
LTTSVIETSSSKAFLPNLPKRIATGHGTTKELRSASNVLSELPNGTMNFCGNIGGVEFNLNGTDIKVRIL